MEATNYRYVVDRMYVQTDRHGRSALYLDEYRKELPNFEVTISSKKFILHLKWRR